MTTERDTRAPPGKTEDLCLYNFSRRVDKVVRERTKELLTS